MAARLDGAEELCRLILRRTVGRGAARRGVTWHATYAHGGELGAAEEVGRLVGERDTNHHGVHGAEQRVEGALVRDRA